MSTAQNLDNHFRQLHNLPDNFRFFRWSCMPEDGPVFYFELEGGIVTKFYRSGPRKGKPNYNKVTDRRTFRILASEYNALFPGDE
jgi:hypothetical protein